ncbi:DUF1972 domain-containing protein [Stenotrophomonas sp. TWI1151]|uniref:DUF1972 domain-containing protein n=1 Tax=Stenotrophomonas sp. TWI1151 TaxID=3136798 RepID=UPI003208F650
MSKPTLRILGIRGVPAAHGGFETFAEYLAVHLVARGWRVVVYCQEDGQGKLFTDTWEGIERVRIPVGVRGAAGTILFDWLSTLHASRSQDLCLTLGYNTAVFAAVLKLKGAPNVINMDGIEWARAKWGTVAKTWFYLNERAGCWLGDHLIADHPEIKAHLATRTRADRISTIAYGSERIDSADSSIVEGLGLVPGNYLTVIARPEPENSILEIVDGFSRRSRSLKLVVLGSYSDSNSYHQKVRAAAGTDVVFVGAIYERSVVHALRFHSAAYVHGHQVGGTNPSLVEAMGAGNPIIAHDNRFNRWVAGEGAQYFDGALSFARIIDQIEADSAPLATMAQASLVRFEQCFTWPKILQDYEELLSKWIDGGRSDVASGRLEPDIGGRKVDDV